MSGAELLRTWEDRVDWIGNELMHDGIEGCVLQPLGQARAAPVLVRHSFGSGNYIRRKVAASLGGYLEAPEPALLRELFDAERARDAAFAPTSVERLYCQSAVEDIVFSAARWCRRDALRPAAFALLSDVVARTLAGEYWNTASYAITTLCYHRAPGSSALLNSFQAFCTPSLLRKVRPPDHPSRPTLEQERQFAKGLAAGNPATLHSITNLLAQKDDAARRYALTDEGKQWLAKLLALAGAL